MQGCRGIRMAPVDLSLMVVVEHVPHVPAHRSIMQDRSRSRCRSRRCLTTSQCHVAKGYRPTRDAPSRCSGVPPVVVEPVVIPELHWSFSGICACGLGASARGV